MMEISHLQWRRHTVSRSLLLTVLWVAGLEFPGDMPSNGISYVDADGVTRNFAVDMSGMDGSLFLWEF